MDKLKKEFDCVEMKSSIQERINKEFEGMSDEQIRAKMLEEIMASNSPFAQALKQRKSQLISR